ncbi:MAG: DNA polymerase III subunit chi [Thiotrichales bacterium]
MTEVSFYILSGAGPEQRLGFIARFVEKLYRDGHKVHLHCADPEQLTQLDQRLWTWRDIGFVPHEIAATPLPDCPVTLSLAPFAGDREVLVNLAREVPEFFSHFERVAEIPGTATSEIEEARLRYKFYQARGYKLQTHNYDVD